MIFRITFALIFLFPTFAFASDLLTNVKSPRFTTDFSKAEILSSAKNCLEKQGGQDVLAEADKVMANMNFEIPFGLISIKPVRTRLKLRAKEKSFRMFHSHIQRYDDYSKKWSSISTEWGQGSEKVAKHLQASMISVERCINQGDQSNFLQLDDSDLSISP